MNYRLLGRLSLSLAWLGMISSGCGSTSGTTGGTAGSGGAGGSGGGSPAACAVAAPAALATCVDSLNQSRLGCYVDTDAPCASSEFDTALTALKDSVEASCSDGDIKSLSVDALVGRLQSSCTSETQSMGSRTFGGPHGAVWPDTTDAGRTCLRTAHEAASVAVSGALERMLFEVTATDPLTLVSVGMLLVLVAVVASWVPAFRAARLDPVEALRAE